MVQHREECTSVCIERIFTDRPRDNATDMTDGCNGYDGWNRTYTVHAVDNETHRLNFQSSSLYSRLLPQVVIAVKTTALFHPDRLQAILQTWGSQDSLARHPMKLIFTR
jgi:hypothetical protein